MASLDANFLQITMRKNYALAPEKIFWIRRISHFMSVSELKIKQRRVTLITLIFIKEAKS
jgi:hypothetical protein